MQAFYPEMGETAKPETEIFASISHCSNHWYLKVSPKASALSGSGLKFLRTLDAETLVAGSKFVGWAEWKVTYKAFERIKDQYRVATECLL